MIPLKASVEFLPPSPIQVPLTVGVYHSPELTAYTHSVAATADEHLIFPVGEATVRLFEGLYPTLFTKTIAVNTRPPFPPGARLPDAVFEPSVEAFAVNVGAFLGRSNLCWAEIVYRFTVYSSSGQVLARWNVRGIGERSGLRSDSRLFADAVELAMRDAAQKLQTSFFDVPEARRWVRQLPANNVNAPAKVQTTRREQQTVWAAFPGVAAATAEITSDAQASGVLSAKIRVKNEGSHRLFVRPFEFTLTLRSGEIVRPAPASALVAAAAPAYSRVPPLGYGPGMTFGGPPGFAIGNLVAVLINLALEEAENRQIEEVLARYRTEALKDTTLWQGDSIEVVIHFVAPPEAGMPQTLAVPLIDLDTATRYRVQLTVR